MDTIKEKISELESVNRNFQTENTKEKKKE